jgi:DNA mismatch repair protein MutS2
MRSLVAASDLSIAPAVDTAEMTRRAAQGQILTPRELRLVGEAIAAASSAYRAVRDDDVLREVASGYASVEDVRAAIERAVDERDVVLDRASPALSRIRRSIVQAQGEARERVSALVRSAKYARAIQETVVTIREGRYVVPVRAEFASDFPGIVHDTSASGQTLFIEPLTALESNNRLRTLRIEEEREVERVLSELSRLVAERALTVETNVDILAALDLLVANAHAAHAMDAVMPELMPVASLRIVGGRHPLLDDRAVPQSLELDDQTRLIVVSGPNMGGKTVTLKMVGLLVAMTYAGLQIPAETGSAVGCFSCVVADIGDEQSIAANASTFSAHLDRMREALSVAGESALVLVDEIGAGTEPSAGAALAIAMLERLLAVRARAIVTTHATELKLFAHRAAGAVNGSVRFDPQTFAPTYQLDLGAPGQSLAFALARTRGLDPAIIERADGLLDAQEREYERALEELAQRSAELQTERDALTRERSGVETERREIERRTAQLDAERARFAERAQQRLQQALRDFAAELQHRAPGRRPGRVTAAQSAALAETLEAMRRDLGIGERPQSGAWSARPNIRLSDTTGETGPSAPLLEAKRIASNELDVRGKRYAEAEPLVDRWIDDALLTGSSPLRLIHGKGTGALGRGLQAFLREHPAVAGVRYGTEEEGSSGVTIIELR